MKKRKAFDGILHLPDPSEVDLNKKRRKPDVCEECKGRLIFGRGYGRCEDCQITYAVPIARILTKGPHFGKEVYLKEAIMMELLEEFSDFDARKEAFQDELHTREYFVIEEIRREN